MLKKVNLKIRKERKNKKWDNVRIDVRNLIKNRPRNQQIKEIKKEHTVNSWIQLCLSSGSFFKQHEINWLSSGEKLNGF